MASGYGPSVTVWVPETPARSSGRGWRSGAAVSAVGSAIVSGRSERVAPSLLYWSLRRFLELLVLRRRSQREKEIEILLLRHQLMVLERQVACPAPRSCVDRWLGWSAGQSWRRVAPEGLSGVRLRMGRSTEKETGLSEQRKYRSWTARQKIEIVLAGLRGDRSVKDVCREHEISDTLFYSWRDKLLEGGREALAGKEERSGERELRRKIRELERALGRKTYELEIAGEALRGWE